jgi:hypothetical protein
MYKFSKCFSLPQRTRLLEGKKKMFGNILKNSIFKMENWKNSKLIKHVMKMP